ncbi:MAG TPA: FHA domain-containing protein [Gemmataceae bacterium]|jgi:pSer/pThr/pTyr-binding forkhead associated (FHA) protein
MRRESEDCLKPGQPALIVTYGNTTRKHRPLDRDVLLMGRAPSCDVTLISPEVAPVHCLIYRLDDGWCLRDCSGGRHATRLNGRTAHEEMLHDGDVIQIGAFTFEARLPASHPTPSPGSTPVVDDPANARVKRLLRSRRNLVRLALRLRERVRRGGFVPPSLAELEHHAECLRGLQRDYEALLKEYESRLAEVEKTERELCDERAAFERECTERRTRLEKAEHDMARRQAEAQALMRQRWEECQQRCRQADQAHAKFMQALPERDASLGAAVSQELARILNRRSQELNYFARYLRRCRQQVREQAPGHAEEEAKRWQEQCQALQAELSELDARTRQRQTELESERDRARGGADALASTVKELQGIHESLRREIHDRDVALETLRRRIEQQAARANLEHSGSYERELNAFRLELENDREELNEQIGQLQVRQAEMEAAAREAELQMSRERAVIARERAELTRLRDEIRIAKDRTAREGGLRDRLANIHRLKQELAASNSSSAPGDQLRPAAATLGQ